MHSYSLFYFGVDCFCSCRVFGLFFHDSGIDFIGEAGGVGFLMEAKISDCLLGFGYFNFALGGCEVGLEARP